MNRRRSYFALLFAASLFFPAARADEGMWLFNAPPQIQLKQRYDFDLTDQWLEHLRLSTVRFSGASASFVSGDGLVMTNHHVGLFTMHKLSRPDRDLLADGFYARSLDEELKCENVELNVLASIEDVTGRIEAAVAHLSNPAQAAERRRAEMNTIEKESFEKTGLKSEVVGLYYGGLYHLYRYKVYTDVRLVFSPEESVAAFGGDPDNFEYPRYSLDVCFFRAYEDGKPAKTPHYLKWNTAGSSENELVFMAGHPARTQRQKTVGHLEYLRDVTMPASLDQCRRLEVALLAYSERSAENRRRASAAVRGAQNSRKARLGMLAGLQDPAVLKIKQAEEESLRRAAAADPKLAAQIDAALKTIDQTLQTYEKIRSEYEMLEAAQAFHSGLFHTARTLVRMVDELSKPNAERLRGFQDTNLDALKRGLLADAPIYPDLETAMLASSLGMYTELVGYRDPLVRGVMAGRSPPDRAEELIGGTRLGDVDFRRRLVEGGAEAIARCDDPMIRLAQFVDGPARKLRAICEREVNEPQTRAYGMLANVRFALYGDSVPPDATGTLRLSFGEVLGYRRDGETIPAFTMFSGLYRRAESNRFAQPYALPPIWIERRDFIDMTVPMNFISTNDIIGGNSGSPVINRNGEVVGIVFDGNLTSLVWDYVFTQDQGRAVSVHSGAIIEALRKVYHAKRLADELER